VETVRANKRYIYSLKNTVIEDDSGNKQFWNETVFESTRTFSNMFFERKTEILEKIDFFLNNKQWYYDNGIPYTLGIGLYGPPGTGKTSFFKSLANLTGRHLVILSLKEIKTKQKLEEFFFENRYKSENKKGSIGFDKKIIIIEDIDCLGEVVWKREEESTKKKREKRGSSGSSVQDVIQKLIENNNSDSKSMIEIGMEDDDEITLDDILNLWDGIKETPGRILGISSNHYNKLDPALIRPGRIDLSIKLDNCSKETIKEMFEHYYGYKVDMKVLKKIKNKFYSPAEIINCYILNRNSGEAFLNRLLENKQF
jgi:SpoVK/Ycf46/Vps4 family AAA+-type ATPase